MAVSRFDQIFREEIGAINVRRSRLGRDQATLEKEDQVTDDIPILRPTEESDLVGLSLSGGGIRSASFCLGGLQALDTFNILDRVDYLSSVSGGGYIGTSMSAVMSKATQGKFPFPSTLKQDEPIGLQHIRDHSNYLFPRGVTNLFSNIAVYLRGLAANALMVLPVLLFAAAFTIFSNPDLSYLRRTHVVNMPVNLPVESWFFGLTINVLLLFLIALALWALARSVPWRQKWNDVGATSFFFGIALIVILGIAFCELQPIVLYGMFNSAKIISQVVGWMKVLAAALAPVATVIGFFSGFISDALKGASETPGFRATLTSVVLKLLILLVAAALPLILWVVYLYLSYWGIQDCNQVGDVVTCPAAEPFKHTPEWLVVLSRHFFSGVNLAPIYAVAAAFLLVVGLLLRPNANSLHRLYRDRLSKAFLFDPRSREQPSRFARMMRRLFLGTPNSPQVGQDLTPLDDFCIHEINTDYAPYHLINAALNLGGSRYANRRGRNADFFIFSPKYTGSEATQYASTEEMEADTTQLNLATAMAVSGAAASSNMGSNTIKPMTPTLALLNIRLGFWLINPFSVASSMAQPTLMKRFSPKRLFDRLYYLKEMFGLLAEDSELVYLTDGGHVENLGIYELLRRRCQLIIAIDAEADPKMSFNSLVKLERYARIDLGTRIDLPWATIRDATNAASEVIAKTGGEPPDDASKGPHCAIGTIAYPGGREGILIYVKSSLSGDENDYVVDYKRRNPAFPHETTADQLFSEEQFEVYRALGFHAVRRCLIGDDLVAMRPAPAKWSDEELTAPLVERARRILGLAAA